MMIKHKEKAMDKSEFQYGEMVEVQDRGNHVWEERIFMGSIKKAMSPFICVAYGCNDEFYQGCCVRITAWQLIRKIKKPVVEITCRVNGKETKLSDISEETLEAIRASN
jgi:hypothetical protein